ncbi:MAG: DUF72 domain-containing protein [Nanoarchaeota archaeon]
MKYYLGTSGWSYSDWEQKFYPSNFERSKWLNYYSVQFNTVEVNSTFYRFPFKNIVRGWYNKTPKDFKFVLKANRLITHIHKLKNIEKYLKSFYALADLLKEKLAVILFQLPPSLKFDEKRLKDFLNTLNTKYKHAMEFRNSTWFNEECYKILKNYKVAYCIVSAPNLPVEPKVTAKFSYIRFHGVDNWYAYNYSNKELRDWAKIIRNLKCREVYAYFNNDYNAYAVRNCLHFKKLLERNSEC